MTPRPRTRRDIVDAARRIDVDPDASKTAIARAIAEASRVNDEPGLSQSTVERAFRNEPALLDAVRQMTRQPHHDEAAPTSNDAEGPADIRESPAHEPADDTPAPAGPDPDTSLSICYLHAEFFPWKLRRPAQCVGGCDTELEEGEWAWLTHWASGTLEPVHCDPCREQLPALTRSAGFECEHPPGRCPSDPNSPNSYKKAAARLRPQARGY